MRQVVDACAKVTGRDIPVEEGPRRPGDPPKLVASAARARARARLGAAPSPSIETMIDDAWAWYQAHPEGYSGSPRSAVGARADAGRPAGGLTRAARTRRPAAEPISTC